MNRFCKFFSLFISVFLLNASLDAQFYTSSQTQFGKNRVQYEKFLWTYIDYGTYKVYFYQGGEKTAHYVAEKGKEYIASLANLMDCSTPSEVDFMVYDKESEYTESNLNLPGDMDYNIGGVNRIVGKKVAVYCEGNHAKLDEQIRLGIAKVLFQQLMYGGSFTNVVRSSALVNIPPWFEQGFVNYAARGWNTEIDGYVKDGIMSGRYKKFNHLTGTDATYAGISIWNYIAQTYGESVIPQMLYIARSSRSIETAFLYSLGTSLKGFSADWLTYYSTQYKKDWARDSMPKTAPLIAKPKKDVRYFHLETSPDGRYDAYATNDLGQSKVWLLDKQTNKRTCILKQGQKINRIYDFSYPLIAWHPSGQIFSIIMESKGMLMLYTYTLYNHKLESRRMMNFQKILDFSYSDDGTKFALSAVQNGQSDIFIFTAASNAYEQITNDVFDDLNPRFIDHSSKIIFSSNRPDDTIRKTDDFKKMQNALDIFVYNNEIHSKVLRRITNTPNVNETNPTGYSNNYVSYLSNESGITNRYLAYVDSTISFVDTSAHYRYIVHSFPITDFKRSIVEQDASPMLRYYSQTFYSKGRYYLYSDSLPVALSTTPSTAPMRTGFMMQFQKYMSSKTPADTSSSNQKRDTGSIFVTYPTNPVKPQPTDTANKPKDMKTDPFHIPVNVNDYSFDEIPSPPSQNLNQPVAPKKSNPKPTALNNNVTIITDSGKRKKPLLKDNYYVSFAPTYFGLKIDNSYLNSSYQPFTGNNGPEYLNPAFDLYLNGEVQDLFEDYRITGGARLAVDFSNNEYFLKYDDLSKRLDKELTFHRVALLQVPLGNELLNMYTLEATYTLKYPFSEVARLEGSLGIRDDKKVPLSGDVESLELPSTTDYWGHFDLNYVYDATIPIGLNINSGFRGRAFAQYYNDISRMNSNMVILGLDLRYYQKISRDLIWANRFSAGTSFGQERLLYYLGGVENWFSPDFISETGITSGQNYAFQTLADPMRGFDQNIRNGTSFMLYNSEIRFPIFHYLLNRPIKSDFFNNFQFITFCDVGTAWTGATPYTNVNAINTTVVGSPGNPITVIISTQQYPFVEGFGEGVRTRILGYFVRLDEAWGVNNGVVISKPVTYFSLSLDF